MGVAVVRRPGLLLEVRATICTRLAVAEITEVPVGISALAVAAASVMALGEKVGRVLGPRALAAIGGEAVTTNVANRVLAIAIASGGQARRASRATLFSVANVLGGVRSQVTPIQASPCTETF